ncbi:hypothetical protein NWF32_17420 [Pseudomonas qingdaonensis]|nr:hypothetical protein [Pseudomonas qingdaonensis]
MRNVSVIWCIKAWSAPINQGNIDIAALAALAAQATETNLGMVRIATQAQVNAGLADDVLVTQKNCAGAHGQFHYQRLPGFPFLAWWVHCAVGLVVR